MSLDAHFAAVEVIHRFEAIEMTELVEVSTPELDDVIRAEDDFGREGTREPYVSAGRCAEPTFRPPQATADAG